MNKSIKQRLYQTSALLYGYTTDPTFNNAAQAPTVTETVSGLNVPDINGFQVYSMRPYGFTSMPNPNTVQVVMPSGVSSNNAVILGHLDVFSGKPFSLLAGESVIYSNNMAMKAGNDSIQYFYNGSIATAISGEDVNQIFADIIIYLEGTIQNFYTSVVNIFNEHTHNVVGGGSTVTPNQDFPDPPEFPEDLINDLSDVQEGKTLINSSGTTPL